MNQAISVLEDMICECTESWDIEVVSKDEIIARVVGLEEAKKRISYLPSDTQWIDVKEDPGQAGEYLIFDPEDSRCTDYFIRGKWEYTNPTHWMPLPTPPNN